MSANQKDLSWIEIIGSKARKMHPFQSKAIAKFHSSTGSEFQLVSDRYLELLFCPQDNSDMAVESFITMSKDFLTCQIRFQKTLEYPVQSQAQAYADVYSDQRVMSYYMRGLYLSYFLWPNHWRILQFFRRCTRNALLPFKNNSNERLKILEVAPGHGLFTANVFELANNIEFVQLVDISKTSLEIAQENLAGIKFVDDTKIVSTCADFINFNTDHRFDYVILGEVLEHVDDPVHFLERIKSLLSTNGVAFLTTCTDAPSIDHCFHYRHCDEVRSQFNSVGLKVISDLEISSVPDQDVAYCYENRLTVNYCALVGLS